MSWRRAHRCSLMVLVVTFISALAPCAWGQPTSRPGGPDDRPPLKKEELEQLLAPVALYPDSLLTQMLMASTYPIEVIQADRWVKANKALKGDALAKELEKQTWDASVKSMVNFPEQLAAMSDKLELTLKIGNAFIEQQADVLNTVQVLRNRAQASGNLKSNDQQNVAVQVAPATPATGGDIAVVTVQAPPQIITIESPSPDVIYVPSYNPVYVYGGWPYAAYPPYAYYPPSYYYGSAAVSFGLGVACGAAWGYAWGHANWNNCDVDIDVDRNFNRNTNINRDQARQNIQNRQTNRQDNRTNRQGNGQSWRHDPSHRKGAAYRDQRTSDRFGGAGSSRQATQAREQFRGRSDAAWRDSARTAGAGQFRASDGVGNRPGAGSAGQYRSADVGNRASAGTASPSRGGTAGGFDSRGGAGGATAGQNRAATADRGYSGTRGGTFSGVDRGSSGARAESSRGQSSGGYRAAPSRSGGGSYGGGGSRGGGGGRAGGGRGGGRR